MLQTQIAKHYITTMYPRTRQRFKIKEPALEETKSDDDISRDGQHYRVRARATVIQTITFTLHITIFININAHKT